MYDDATKKSFYNKNDFSSLKSVTVANFSVIDFGL
jgi:hypothetical protein